MRYGYSPAKMAATLGSGANQTGLGIASVANQARERERAGGFAKKLDVAGLYRGLPGASQGAYSLANQSGNSAVANTMAPGAQRQTGSIAAAGIYGQGQQSKLQGLTGIMNAQGSYANAVANMDQGDSGMGGLGSLLGGGAAMYTAVT